jgi:DNA repair protein RecN (Recombination protein N)
LLQNLGRRQLVVCITHLAQIAAGGAVQIHLSKHTKAGRPRTVAPRLDETGRELEIARMIAGAAISPQVLASARELLAARRESEAKTKGESENKPLAKAKGRRA